MAARRIDEREIERQRRIISELKREIFGADKTETSGYIRDFLVDFRRYSRVTALERVFDRAARASIVYFGDYHPLDASQTLALRLMRELAERGRRLVLCLEMLYTRQQPILDRWMKGSIDEQTFLREIDYRSEWGFSWPSYRRLFEAAREPFTPIFGIDEEPRDHLRFIRRRDRLMARRIANISRFFPDHVLLVVVGESHVAAPHIPAAVARLLGGRPRTVTIVQNVDEIWWRLLRRGRTGAEAVTVDPGRYCVISAPPLVKYQAYRRRLDLWIEGEAADDHAAVFRDMIADVLMVLCGESPPEVTVCPGYRDSIEALLPEVHCRSAYAAFSTLLRERQAGYLAVLAGLERLRTTGASYLPSLNAVLCLGPGDGSRAHEAARFVLYALRDEIGAARRRSRPEPDRFAAWILEEACCRFGARLLSPASEPATETDPLVSAIDERGVCRRRAGHLTLKETRELAADFKYHVRREERGLERTTARLSRIHRLPIRRRMLVVCALGHTLGDALYRAFGAGMMTAAELRLLFADPLAGPGAARARYLDLVRRLRPDRGRWRRP